MDHYIFPLFLSFASVTSRWSPLMEGKYYQGDMILTDEQISEYENQRTDTPGRTLYGAGSTFSMWPKYGKYVKIKYMVEKSIDDPYLRSVLQKVFASYHQHTCLRFVEDKSRDIDRQPHVRFVDGNGCASPVGRRLFQKETGRYIGNKIMLHNSESKSCWHYGIIMHELCHTVGFFHEQSRPDRDQYVEIVWENIKRVHGKDMSFNFRKEKLVDAFSRPYDYLSMMHYGQSAFGDGKITIRTKDPAFQTLIGQRDGFSKEDIKAINDLYECKM